MHILMQTVATQHRTTENWCVEVRRYGQIMIRDPVRFRRTGPRATQAFTLNRNLNDKKQVLTRHTFVIIDGAQLYEQIDRIGERRYSLSRAVCVATIDVAATLLDKVAHRRQPIIRSMPMRVSHEIIALAGACRSMNWIYERPVDEHRRQP